MSFLATWIVISWDFVVRVCTADGIFYHPDGRKDSGNVFVQHSGLFEDHWVFIFFWKSALQLKFNGNVWAAQAEVKGLTMLFAKFFCPCSCTLSTDVSTEMRFCNETCFVIWISCNKNDTYFIYKITPWIFTQSVFTVVLYMWKKRFEAFCGSRGTRLLEEAEDVPVFNPHFFLF